MDAVGVRRMTGGGRARREHGRPGRENPRAPVIPLFFLSWLLAAWLQAAGGCFRADFDGYPDEPAHYVTGLMVRDYLVSGRLLHPMAYAENYYLHYPKVAIGHWPPGFYLLQAIWMLMFGPGRVSILLLMSAVTAAVAAVMFLAGRRLAGPWWAAGAAAVFVCVPMVQANTGMVMAESLLALGGLLAAYSFGRYLETGATRPALWFGVWSLATILVKGNGWSLVLLPLIALGITGQWRKMRDWRLWAAAAIVALALPWQIATMRMVENGWGAPWGLSYVRASLNSYVPALTQNLGFAILSLAAIGFLRVFQRRPGQFHRDPMLAALAALFLGVLLFHAVVPANLDSRRLILALPPLLLIAVHGAAWLGGRFGPRIAWGIAVAAGAWFALRVFTIPQKPVDCSSDAAKVALQISPGPSGRLLVAGGSSSEGAFVAEVARREERPGHYVLRASKMLLDSDWSGAGAKLRYSTAAAEEKIESLGVAAIALGPVESGGLPTVALTRQMIDAYPDRWKPVPLQAGCAGKAALFRYAGPRRANSSPIELDLRRMLGRTISSGGSN